MKKLAIGIGVRLGSSAAAVLPAAFNLPRFALDIGGFIPRDGYLYCRSISSGWHWGQTGIHVHTGLRLATSPVSTWLALSSRTFHSSASGCLDS